MINNPTTHTHPLNNAAKTVSKHPAATTVSTHPLNITTNKILRTPRVPLVPDVPSIVQVRMTRSSRPTLPDPYKYLMVICPYVPCGTWNFIAVGWDQIRTVYWFTCEKCKRIGWAIFQLQRCRGCIKYDPITVVPKQLDIFLGFIANFTVKRMLIDHFINTHNTHNALKQSPNKKKLRKIRKSRVLNIAVKTHNTHVINLTKRKNIIKIKKHHSQQTKTHINTHNKSHNQHMSLNTHKSRVVSVIKKQKNKCPNTHKAQKLYPRTPRFPHILLNTHNLCMPTKHTPQFPHILLNTHNRQHTTRPHPKKHIQQNIPLTNVETLIHVLNAQISQVPQHTHVIKNIIDLSHTETPINIDLTLSPVPKTNTLQNTELSLPVTHTTRSRCKKSKYNSNPQRQCYLGEKDAHRGVYRSGLLYLNDKEYNKLEKKNFPRTPPRKRQTGDHGSNWVTHNNV